MEWLEADGLGGFASGTRAGGRTRRYHGLLLIATTPPTGRVMLVNGCDAWVETPTGTFAISGQRYAPDVVYPDGDTRLRSFTTDPWPHWVFELEDKTVIEHELFAVRGQPLIALCWRLREPRAGVSLTVRPFVSGRDYHATHHENPAFNAAASIDRQQVVWRPYPSVPAIIAASNGQYLQQPDWFRNFLYTEERARGLDDTEDLASPGLFRWDLSTPAVLLIGADAEALSAIRTTGDVQAMHTALREAERERRVFRSPLHRAADAYLVRRASGQTIVAGYPWFTDWGRDTFIAVRGLCIATGRLTDARDVLLAWAGHVSCGMLPNRFPDSGGAAEYNAVDASLWYIVAVGELLDAVDAAATSTHTVVTENERAALNAAVDQIVAGYAAGTRYGIRVDADGLLACGEPGMQLTWMDAKVGDRVVTPRIGKPVEVQALWLNALAIAAARSKALVPLFRRGRRAFTARFWNDANGCLFDVVDVNHRVGEMDASFRPNQIFAVGGLPLSLLPRARARRVVDAVEARLVTPMGLRSLAPDDRAYAGRYEGNSAERDCCYHQGSVWPWLIGPFVEAWVRVRGNTASASAEARARFLTPLLDLATANGGHLPEIADGDPPHTPRGCPCQAWSVSEVLRLEASVLRSPLADHLTPAARAITQRGSSTS